MATTADGLPFRRAARVIIVDEADRVLLFYGPGLVFQDSDYYFTVGGGVDGGESLAEAAAREVFEETGLRVEPEALRSTVAHTEGPWTTHDGIRFYSDDHFFFLRAAHFEPDLSGLEDGEEREMSGHAWLTLADLEATDAVCFPAGLPDVIRAVLAGPVTETIELPWVDRTRGGTRRGPV